MKGGRLVPPLSKDFGVHCEMTTKRKKRKENPDTRGENARHAELSRRPFATINLCKLR